MCTQWCKLHYVMVVGRRTYVFKTLSVVCDPLTGRFAPQSLLHSNFMHEHVEMCAPSVSLVAPSWTTSLKSLQRLLKANLHCTTLYHDTQCHVTIRLHVSIIKRLISSSLHYPSCPFCLTKIEAYAVIQLHSFLTISVKRNGVRRQPCNLMLFYPHNVASSAILEKLKLVDTGWGELKLKCEEGL